MKRRTDRELANELTDSMKCDPCRSWSRSQLAKRVGATTLRLSRVLHKDDRFEINPHRDERFELWRLSY